MNAEIKVIWCGRLFAPLWDVSEVWKKKRAPFSFGGYLHFEFCKACHLRKELRIKMKVLEFLERVENCTIRMKLTYRVATGKFYPIVEFHWNHSLGTSFSSCQNFENFIIILSGSNCSARIRIGKIYWPSIGMGLFLTFRQRHPQSACNWS